MNQKKQHNSHDQFFKTIFAAPAQAVGLLRFALPPETIASLDLEHLAPMPESFVQNIGGEGRADLLFHCPVIGTHGELLIAVLFEHKSYPDSEVLVQMVRYWANLILKDQAMPILPILFYHGSQTWTPPTFRERFPNLPENLRPYQPEFPIVFIDMARGEDSAIWSNEILDAKAKLGLIILKHIFDEVPNLETLMDMLAQVLSEIPEQKRPDLMKAVYLYLLYKGGYPKEPLENAMDRIPEAQKMPFKTWAEGLREEGEVIGKAELVTEMLRNGADWDMITKLTHITPEEFEQMKGLGK